MTREAEEIKKKKIEERKQHSETLKSIKKNHAENLALLKIYRSVLKTYLFPIKDTTLKGIVKSVDGEHPFAIDCASLDQRELHQQVWGNIAKQT